MLFRSGLATNVQFLRRVLATPSFVRPCLDTALIQRQHASLFGPNPIRPEWAVAAALAHLLGGEDRARESAQWLDPWARGDGFALCGRGQRRWRWRINGQVVDSTLYSAPQPMLQVADLPSARWWFAMGEHGAEIVWGEQRLRAQVHTLGEQWHVFMDQGACKIGRAHV